jgi:hypothetical protein
MLQATHNPKAKTEPTENPEWDILSDFREPDPEQPDYEHL